MTDQQSSRTTGWRVWHLLLASRFGPGPDRVDPALLAGLASDEPTERPPTTPAPSPRAAGASEECQAAHDAPDGPGIPGFAEIRDCRDLDDWIAGAEAAGVRGTEQQYAHSVMLTCLASSPGALDLTVCKEADRVDPTLSRDDYPGGAPSSSSG